jgi:hypothetical protein
MTEKINAFWFASSDRLPHGDSREIAIGKRHSLRGEIIICEHALHASRDPFDALSYSSGPYLYKVRCWGDVVEQIDKLGARNREYVAMMDATNMLLQFAREQALSVVHLWDAPEIVKAYLETGNEDIKEAAMGAAVGATRETPTEASTAASTAAAWAASRATSVTAAWEACWAASKATAWAASRAMVWETAWETARETARNKFNELTAALFTKTPQ